MFQVHRQDKYTRARTGTITTAHGAIETPAYVMVGTHAAVRCLTKEQLAQTNTQVIIANTYHLWKTLSETGLSEYPGLHKKMDWNHPLMTDSGGFQVFSMGFARVQGVGKLVKVPERAGRENMIEITEDGVYFNDEGQRKYLDAEKSIAIQQKLGADMIIAFDECTSPLHDYEYTKKSLERTHRWAQRSLKAKTSSQILYGVVQGGVFEDLRNASARFIGNMPFDGFAIGGSFGNSFGGTKEDTFRELEWSVPLLPPDRPRHLLGIGRIDDLLFGVERGLDTFDCVVPTREGRHGWIWTLRGKLDITKGIYSADTRPIDEECGCPVCALQHHTRQFLQRLFKEKDPLAGELATLHNVYFFNDFMQKIRKAITEDRFLEFKEKMLNRLRHNSSQPPLSLRGGVDDGSLP